jgi:hypothetical protein
MEKSFVVINLKFFGNSFYSPALKYFHGSTHFIDQVNIIFFWQFLEKEVEGQDG